MFKIQAPAMPGRSAEPRDDDSLGHNTRSATSSDGLVGRRIKTLRRRLGLTQKQVAARIGVTGPQFHRYEVGATRVAASRLMDIATALGVRPADLMRDETAQDTPRILGGLTAPDDLVELVEMFSSIGDQRRRGALVTFARSLVAGDDVPAEAA